MLEHDPIQRRTILCVDDDEDILRQLQQLLRRDGHDILLATSGQQGLELLAKHHVALIISHQTMPGMVEPEAIRNKLSGHTDVETAI